MAKSSAVEPVVCRSRRTEYLPVQKVFTKPTLTEQHHKDLCDANKLICKYGMSNLQNSFNLNPGFYDDFSNVDDYHSALNKVISADNAFMSLSAKIRSKFDNDIGKFLEFTLNPDNKDEMIELGLIDKPVLPVVSPVETSPQDETKTVD